jgi:two-component system sensor histidine kinase PilS (NtrC family)
MTSPGTEPHVERRRAERRHSDRRQALGAAPEDSWFGALADGNQSTLQPGFGDESRLEPEGASSESRFLAREARRIVVGEGSALRRVFGAYVAARAALGTALVLTPWIMSLLGTRLAVEALLVCMAYAVQAVSMWLLPPSPVPGMPASRLVRRQWALTIGVDLFVFSVLHLLEPGAHLNYAALLALPVLMAGVMTKRVGALATAALVSLVLLAGVWRASLSGAFSAVLLTQAGLGGLGAFAITLLSGELAQRLAREERTARGSLELARQQARLNRLVIEEMTDGVLVVDRRCRVRAANPAARGMLGARAADRPAPFALHGEAGWETLLQAIEKAFGAGRWPREHRELTLPHVDGGTHTVQVRARFTKRSGIGEEATAPQEVCVLFLEDMRSVQARVQQEKLAAMGRMSAGIAHEIRNPLAAIAQANALMLEDDLAGAQQRLARIVEDNVERLKRIVDDVMAVAPGTTSGPQAIDATAEVARICREWLATSGLPSGTSDARVELDLPPVPMPVLFDPEHLRRVLTNLLDNACRHGTETPGAVVVCLRHPPAQAPGGALLTVASDGPPIAPDVERHLFEPFFSTRSRGTGLGLYICRELCERYRASIDYRPGPAGGRHRNVFRVLLRSAPTA